ncbi:hypothetical protein AT292_18245 [Enterobacter cloacae]|nr:hypothetical protein AT292_18245 [Enterobacter cloacae]
MHFNNKMIINHKDSINFCNLARALHNSNQWLIHLLMSALRDVLHKLRMTHKKVPAVQLLIIAMLYQARAKRRVRHRLIP